MQSKPSENAIISDIKPDSEMQFENHHRKQFIEPTQSSPNVSDRKTPSPTDDEYQLIGNNFLSPIEEESARKMSKPMNMLDDDQFEVHEI